MLEFTLIKLRWGLNSEESNVQMFSIMIGRGLITHYD